MSKRHRSLSPEWEALAKALAAMAEEINTGEVELNTFAERFGVMAHAYHRAIRSAGKTSIRIRAMLKALDLSTPKSVLENFVGDDTPGSLPVIN